MKTNKITWKLAKSSYTEYHFGYLGNVQVFRVGWSGFSSRGSANNWTLSWRLPFDYEHNGESVSYIHFESREDAMQFAEDTLAQWFEVTGTGWA